jgi:hypothetical protein
MKRRFFKSPSLERRTRERAAAESRDVLAQIEETEPAEDEGEKMARRIWQKVEDEVETADR